MSKRRWSKALAATGGVIGLGACSMLGGLDTDSTCADWADATAEQQNSVVLELVAQASGGERNPLRETNALFQISSVCANGADDIRLGDIEV